MLVEIVLSAPESQREVHVVQVLDKDHGRRSNAWFRDTTSHVFEDDEAFRRGPESPL